MDKLKPCPFCGGKAALLKSGKEWYVECIANQFDCFCKPWTGYFDAEKYAIEAWNRRAEDGKETN